jgi:thiol-disulfide isomerase/thioredoxin
MSTEIPSLHSKAEYLKAVMYEGVTILEGTATWCQQCKVIAPEVAKMVGEYPNVCNPCSRLFPIYIQLHNLTRSEDDVIEVRLVLHVR